jgi:hypothetical protein
VSDTAHEGHPSLEELDLLVDDPAGHEAGRDGLAAHVAGCPRCADAVADLADVRALLRAEAAHVPPPPRDLDERIAAALARAAQEQEDAPTPGATAATVVPIRERRSRPPRWAAAAAGLVVLGGAALTASQLLGDREGPVAGVAQEAAQREEDGAAGGAAEGAASAPVVATGTDYLPQELDEQVSDLVARGTAPGGGAESATAEDAGPGGDARLTDPAALQACLEALGADPGAAAVVDLASWQGRDAAVIVLEEPSRHTVWVVERGCRQGADGLVHYQVVPR